MQELSLYIIKISNINNDAFNYDNSSTININNNIINRYNNSIALNETNDEQTFMNTNLINNNSNDKSKEINEIKNIFIDSTNNYKSFEFQDNFINALKTNLENKSKFILNKINDITFIDNSKNQFINQHIDKPIFKVYARNNPKKQS